jgi:hypothetical protein
MRALPVALFLAMIGCDNGPAMPRVPDGAAPLDLQAPADLAVPPGPLDATCKLQTFMSFEGYSPTLRLLDCTCGCIVDKLDNATVNAWWGEVMIGTSSFNPMVTGLELDVTSTGLTALAALNSQSAAGPFYLDGDFDVLVDYSLPVALPADGHVLLTVQDPGAQVSYAVERNRDAAGNDQYTGTLAGLPPISMSTSAMTGTLELKRTGSTVAAIADGATVTKYISAGTGRFVLILTSAIGSCSGSCSLRAVLRNVHMTGGALVDRR